MGNTASHFRFAARRLLRSPGFTLAAVMLLATGIGANATVFHLVDSVLLRPLTGVSDPERLLDVGPGPHSYPFYRDVREGAAAVADVAAFRVREMAVAGDARALPANVALVSGSWFPVIGAGAARGRPLREADDVPGGASVAVVSHGYHVTRLGADPGVLGRVIRVNGAPYTVVGVAPKNLRGLRLVGAPDVYIPITQWDRVKPPSMARLTIDRAGWGWLNVVARVHPGVSLEAAASVLESSALRHMESASGQVDAEIQLSAEPARLRSIPSRARIRTMLALLWAAVGWVFLVAITNVAYLVLARAESRQREFGVRLALGAGRRHLVAEVLAESAMLAALAGAASVGVVFVASRAITGFDLPNGLDFAALITQPDLRVYGVVALLSFATAAGVAMLPAWSATGRTLAGITLARAGGRGPSRVRSALLVLQVALSLVMLIGTGLFARALRNAARIELGMDPGAVALATVNFELGGYDRAQAPSIRSSIEERIRSVPGVLDVAWTASVPLTGDESTETFDVTGREPAAAQDRAAEINLVSPAYFDVLGVPLVAGRTFDASDRTDTPPVAIINETMARRTFPAGDALGAEIEMMGARLRIVGIARDMKYHTLEEPPVSYLYGAVAQHPGLGGGTLTLIARTQNAPATALPGLRSALADAAPRAPILRATTLDQLLAVVLLPQRMGALLLGLFAGLGLLVAGVGVYGTVALLVGQRAREIAIRSALGARPGSLLQLVVRQTLLLASGGVLLGIALGLAGARFLEGLLYGIRGHDLPTYAVMIMALLAVAALAAYLPARRALRLSAVHALRE